MANSNIAYEILGGYSGEEIKGGSKLANIKPGEPASFDPSQLAVNFGYLMKDDFKAAGIADFAKNFFIDDPARRLAVQASPQSDNIDWDRATELGDAQQVIGTQVRINLNPLDIIKDPEKWAKKNVSGVVNAVFNFDDYASASNMTLAGLLVGNQSGNNLAAYELVKPFYKKGLATFQLQGLGHDKAVKKREQYHADTVPAAPDDRITGTQDLFYKSSKSFIEMYGFVKANSPRNGAMNKVTTDGINAISWELWNAKQEGKITGTDAETVTALFERNKLFRRMSNLAGGIDADVYMDNSGQEYWHIDRVSVPGKRIPSKGLKGLSNDHLGAFIIKGYKAPDAKGEWKKLEDRIRDIIDRDGMLDQIGRELASSELTLAGHGNRDHLVDFRSDADRLRSYMNDVRASLAYDMTEQKWLSMSPSARLRWVENYKGKVDLALNRASQTAVVKGMDLKMKSLFLQRNILNPKAEIAKLISEHVEAVGSRNMQLVLREALRVYNYYDGSDLIYRLEKDGYMGVLADYFWNLARTRINGFAPAKKIEQWLTERHYFGLVYNDEYDTNFLYGKFTGAGHKWLDNLMRLGIFSNTQTITFSIGGKKINFTFLGDKNLTLAMQLHERLFEISNPLNEWKINSMEDFFKLLNGEDDIKYKIGFTPNFDSKHSEMLEQARKLREWIYLHREQLKKLGFNIEFVESSIAAGTYIIKTTPENYEIITSLFGALYKRSSNKDFVSILQSKAGLLQKFASKLSRFQTFIFEKTKIFRPLTWLGFVTSKAAANFVAAIFNKILGFLISAGLPGIGTLLWETIGKLVQAIVVWIVRKVFDFAKKVTEALRKSSTKIIELFVEKSFEFVYKTVAGCIMGCGLAGLGAYFVIMIFIIGVKQVDNSNTSQGLGGTGGGVDPGAGVQCTACCGTNTQSCPANTPQCSLPLANNECEIFESQGCFNLVGDPTQPDEWKTSPGKPAGDPHRIVSNAITNLIGGSNGCYAENVCQAAGGSITVMWAGDSVGCGYASWDAKTIKFGDDGCWAYTDDNQNMFNYLIAHEAGHIYDEGTTANAVAFNDCVDDKWANGGGDLMTYNVAKSVPCGNAGINEQKADINGVKVYPKCGGFSSAPAYEECATISFTCP